jgi:FkbM family methyltransferase
MTSLPPGIIRTNMGVYVLKEDTMLSRWIENGLHLNVENPQIAKWAQYIPVGGVVIDAGACLGDHTLTYSQLVGAEGTVWAFEPHPLTYTALYLNMERLSNVVCIQSALSNTRVSQSLVLDAKNIGASYCVLSPCPGSVDVKCETLDAFMVENQIEECDFIHLDAEGREPFILEGGRQLIQKFKPVMVIEVCDHHLARYGRTQQRLMEMIDAMGYTVKELSEKPHIPERDVLLLPK